MRKVILVPLFLLVAVLARADTNQECKNFCHYLCHKIAECSKENDENLKGECIRECIMAIGREATEDNCRDAYNELKKMSCAEFLELLGIPPPPPDSA